MKKQTNEILIKFEETSKPQNLDEIIYNFQKNMNTEKHNYFLKETENPYIFFLEYPKPDELIRNINTENLHIKDMKKVKCTINNLNYITSTILKKIRYKNKQTDTFKINLYTESFITHENITELKNNIALAIRNILYIKEANNNPTWEINIHIIGELCAINIKRSNKNRNKFSTYT